MVRAITLRSLRFIDWGGLRIGQLLRACMISLLTFSITLMSFRESGRTIGVPGSLASSTSSSPSPSAPSAVPLTAGAPSSAFAPPPFFLFFFFFALEPTVDRSAGVYSVAPAFPRSDGTLPASSSGRKSRRTGRGVARLSRHGGGETVKRDRSREEHGLSSLYSTRVLYALWYGTGSRWRKVHDCTFWLNGPTPALPACGGCPAAHH